VDHQVKRFVCGIEYPQKKAVASRGDCPGNELRRRKTASDGTKQAQMEINGHAGPARPQIHFAQRGAPSAWNVTGRRAKSGLRKSADCRAEVGVGHEKVEVSRRAHPRLRPVPLRQHATFEDDRTDPGIQEQFQDLPCLGARSERGRDFSLRGACQQFAERASQDLSGIPLPEACLQDPC
jgi:hypothetical protein